MKYETPYTSEHPWSLKRIVMGTSRSFFLSVTRRMVLLACVATTLAYLGHWQWYFTLAQFMHHVYLYVLLGALPVLLFFRSRKWAIIAIAGIIVNGMLVFPLFCPAPNQAARNLSPNLRVLSANVYYNNEHIDGLLHLVETLNPDVVCLQEFNNYGIWATAAKQLTQKYPNTTLSKNIGNTDSIIFSRNETQILEQVNASSISWYPFTQVRIKKNGRWVTLLTGHIAAINDARHVNINEADHTGLGEIVRLMPGPVIITGDFNQPAWSPRFRRFQKRAGLISTRKGFGVLGTFPLFFNCISSPIDHILVSPDIQIVNCWVGDDIGSDHRPIIADLYVPPQL